MRYKYVAAFSHSEFATLLYCSAAQDSTCVDASLRRRTVRGFCYWQHRANSTSSGAWQQVAALRPGSTGYVRPGSYALAAYDPERTRWEPPLMAEHRTFRPAAAAACLGGKRLLLLGDSTTRDTFYVLLAALGRPVYSWLRACPTCPFALPSLAHQHWPPDRHHPRAAQRTTAGKDAFGRCLLIEGSAAAERADDACLRDVSFRVGPRGGVRGGGGRQMCVRSLSRAFDDRIEAKPTAPTTECIEDTRMETQPDVAGGGWLPDAPRRVSFMFTVSNRSATMDMLQRELLPPGRAPYDVLAVQCPVLGRLLPNAYNYSLSRAARHAAVPTTQAAVEALRGLGEACLQIVNLVRRHSPSVRVFLLGFAGLVGPKLQALKRSRAGVSTRALERLVFEGIHGPLGLKCVRNDGAPEDLSGGSRGGTAASEYPSYRLESTRGIQVIDRMNTWGGRRPDGQHPTLAAQMATVQMLLNGVCPDTSEGSASTGSS